MKKLLLVVVSLLITLSSSAQQDNIIMDKKNIPSPNVSSFNLYSNTGNPQVTGVQRIEIPLHTIDLDNLNIPISIINNPEGFKPDVHPSWIGHGWNLNAGGTITREVKFGRDEEQNFSTEYDYHIRYGFYFCYKVLDEEKWYEEKDIESPALPHYPQYVYKFLDKSPDIFTFNFLGYSGEFFLNHKGEWKIQSDYPLKVIFDKNDLISYHEIVTGTLPTFSKFTIIDEKGIKYIFGGENAIEFSTPIATPNYNYRDFWTSTTWQLTEIITPKGEHIHFNYERGPYQTSFTYVDKPSLVEQRFNFGIGEETYKAHNYIYNGSTTLGTSTVPVIANVIAGSVISPVYLKEISCSKLNLKITFNTSKSNELAYFETTYTDPFLANPYIPIPVPIKYLDFDPTYNIPYYDRYPEEKAKINPSVFKERFAWLKLDDISISYNETEEKKIKFHFRENIGLRLRLDSLAFVYPEETKSEVYSFEYHPNLSYLYNKEYEYLSEYADHWGFSNLKFLWDKNVSASKSSLIERAKYGVLSKIKYPLGGYTTFIYENHDYNNMVKYDNTLSPTLEYVSDSSGDPLITGGLRIKNIINVDNVGDSYSITYEYKIPNSDQSSGIVYSRGVYRLGNNSFLFDDGRHIKYSNIVEKFEDGSFNGYVFSTEQYATRLGETSIGIFDDRYLRGIIWEGYIPHSSRSFERGKLLDKYQCDLNGKVIKSKHIFYSNIAKDTSNFIRTIDPYYNNRFTTQYSSPSYPEYGPRAVSYYLYSYFNKPTTVYEVTYNKNANIFYGFDASLSSTEALITEKKLEYDNYGQLTKTTITNSNGQIEETVIKYPYSYSVTDDIKKEMINRNMLTYPIEEMNYSNNIFEKGIIYNYDYFQNAIILKSIKDVYKNSSEVLRYTNHYGAGSNLIERTYKNGLTETYLWDSNAAKLKAIVKNASISDISNILTYSQINVGMLTENWESDIHNLRENLPNAQVYSYDYYNNGNLKYNIDEKGVKNSYEYDGNNRLKTIKDYDNYVRNAYGYNYGGGIQSEIFYNERIDALASKLCLPGYGSEPQVISFVIPDGVVTSHKSQQEANHNARLKYAEEIQQLAEASCICTPVGSYFFQEMNNTSPICEYILYSTDIYYRGDNIIANHIALDWTAIEINDYTWYNFDSKGVILGKLVGDRYPVTTRTVEFVDTRKNKNGVTGNVWIISIDTTGLIRVKLKNGYNDVMPKVGEQISFNFTVPLL